MTITAVYFFDNWNGRLQLSLFNIQKQGMAMKKAYKIIIIIIIIIIHKQTTVTPTYYKEHKGHVARHPSPYLPYPLQYYKGTKHPKHPLHTEMQKN